MTDLFTILDTIEYTHHYVFMYIENGMVFASFVDCASDILPSICYADRESSKNGGGVAYKFRPNQKQRNLIKSVASHTDCLCSVVDMENGRANYERHLNRGQYAEILLANQYGGVLNAKPNADLTSGPDIEINGIGWQIKFNKATVCSETSLTHLVKKVG